MHENIKRQTKRNDVEDEYSKDAEERPSDGIEHIHVHAKFGEHFVEKDQIHPSQEHRKSTQLPLYVLKNYSKIIKFHVYISYFPVSKINIIFIFQKQYFLSLQSFHQNWLCRQN